MATAVLNQTHLAFKLPGGVEQTRISTGDELITFGRGTNGATAVLLRGVAAGTSNNDAVSKGQMDTADAAVTAAHQAGDASVTSAFTAADAAIIATASAMDTAYKAADVTLTAGSYDAVEYSSCLSGLALLLIKTGLLMFTGY